MRPVVADWRSVSWHATPGRGRPAGQRRDLRRRPGHDRRRATARRERAWSLTSASSWIQPGVQFGSFQVELRGSKRGDRLHLGRNYAALRELKHGLGVVELRSGRRLLHPRARRVRVLEPENSLGHLQRRRHQRPRPTRGDLHVIGGRATAWRNIFGTDPDTLAQTLGHGPRQRTRSTIASRCSAASPASRRPTCASSASPSTDSKQAGAGIRFILVPAVQLIADGSYVQYRRARLEVQVADGSFLTGASFLLPHGWVQVNASRFSPGEFPAMNDPMHDRESIFARRRIRASGRARRSSAGWEIVTTNIDPDPARCPRLPTCRADRDPRLWRGAYAA